MGAGNFSVPFSILPVIVFGNPQRLQSIYSSLCFLSLLHRVLCPDCTTPTQRNSSQLGSHLLLYWHYLLIGRGTRLLSSGHLAGWTCPLFIIQLLAHYLKWTFLGMWLNHRILQLLSCFNVYLISNVSVFITQDLLYFPFPSKCFWVYLSAFKRKNHKDVNIWCGGAKQKLFKKFKNEQIVYTGLRFLQTLGK